MHQDRHRTIRSLFDAFIEMYAARDDGLALLFSATFRGYVGGGNAAIVDPEQWIRSTRDDCVQLQDRFPSEVLDISTQDLSEHVVLVAARLGTQAPRADRMPSRDSARVVLIFRLEGQVWKIAHGCVSMPQHAPPAGDADPRPEIAPRPPALESVVEHEIRSLQQSESLYRLLTEDALDVLWKLDKNFCITYISPSDEYLRGYKAEELIGRHVYDLFTAEGIQIAADAIKKGRASEKVGYRRGFLSFEAPHRCKDGRTIWGEVFSKPEKDGDGAIIGYHGITREITERKEMQDQIRRLAFYDGLTGLPNRSLLDERLSLAMSGDRRGAFYGALMFVDLDNFKPLNDRHGHLVGDLLLRETADRLKKCVRDTDTVARFGGDEFVVLLNDLSRDRAQAATQAEAVAEKIRATICDTYRLNRRRAGETEISVEYSCSASIGVALFGDGEANPDDVMIWADRAMYEAKSAGRNTVRFYAAEQRSEHSGHPL